MVATPVGRQGESPAYIRTLSNIWQDGPERREVPCGAGPTAGGEVYERMAATMAWANMKWGSIPQPLTSPKGQALSL